MDKENNKIEIDALRSLYEVVMDIYKNRNENEPSNDYNLIINNVHEQAITHKIAHYLENKLEYTIKTNGLSIDCEYNKRKDNPTELHTKITHCNGCCNNHCIVKNNSDNINIIKTSNGNTRQYRPDIILHERNSTNNNILACEIKVITKTCETINDILNLVNKKEQKRILTDFLKLISYTCDNSFKYKLGVSIILTKDKPHFVCFIDTTIYSLSIEIINNLREEYTKNDCGIYLYDNKFKQSNPSIIENIEEYYR